MSVAHAVSHEDEVETLRAAIQDLPPESHERVMAGLADATVQFSEHGRVDPVIDFMKSLLATARLHRNPAYLKALAEADDERDLPLEALSDSDLKARFRRSG